ncbi:MAG: hypothetical protein HYU80_01570 [Candidatus Blackburnbacteria bacterium]|nr:hypothetical protein [Candidatus Blackburnbacteria bacterium]
MTLTETAYWSRSVIKYGIIFISILLGLRIAWVAGFSTYRHFFPAPPPPPEVRFKKLPAIVFTPKPGLPTFSYSLQTPTGELPKFSSQATVHFMPTPQTSFLNLDEASRIAKYLGFPKEVTALSDVTYRFQHPTVPSVLDINIVNRTLSLSYNLNQDTELLNLHPKSTEDASQSARSFLNSASLLAQDLVQGRQTFEFLRSAPEALETVSSISQANFVRVNFWRQDYNNLPILTPKIDRSTVWLLVSGETYGPRQIVAGEYHYFPISQEQKSTYPIKTVQTAWEELTSGKALIISAPPTGGNIPIRRVYLAYYDSGTPQQFLQPVFAFEGDNNFRSFIPAITPEYYGN